MQIASLVTRDGLMAKLNISIPTDDLIERLDDFLSPFVYESQEKFKTYPLNVKANWTEKHEVNLTRIISKEGFCYTFNIPNPSLLLNLDE
jgi:hypothetical protein